ncbi:MAG: hypothetical protein JNN25_13075 [Candidatus Kapabacteria bacterium]|nr:hypothetical protein [Candidatus Kapabacteria bacterium]
MWQGILSQSPLVSLVFLAAILGACSPAEPPINKTIYFTVNLDTGGVEQPFSILYILNGRTHFKFFGNGYTKNMIVDSLQVQVDPKTNNVLDQKWIDLSYLSVVLSDTLMYEAQLQKNSSGWNDWQYSESMNTWSLNLNYTVARYFFIVENRDTTKGYSLRFSTERFQDSVFVIPRGYSARVVHQVRRGTFSLNIRQMDYPPQALLREYMQAQLLSPNRILSLDSAQWQVDAKGIEIYVKHNIYPP